MKHMTVCFLVKENPELDEMPFNSMWPDAQHWIPQILIGNEIQARIVFKGDNETVEEESVNTL